MDIGKLAAILRQLVDYGGAPGFRADLHKLIDEFAPGTVAAPPPLTDAEKAQLADLQARSAPARPAAKHGSIPAGDASPLFTPVA
jgi:hypothetical protein